LLTNEIAVAAAGVGRETNDPPASTSATSDSPRNRLLAVDPPADRASCFINRFDETLMKAVMKHLMKDQISASQIPIKNQTLTREDRVLMFHPMGYSRDRPTGGRAIPLALRDPD